MKHLKIALTPVLTQFLPLFFSLMLALFTPGNAEDDVDPFPKKEGWLYTVGVGVMSMPAFLGSKESMSMIFPDLKVEYGETFSASLFEGTTYKVVNGERWSLGPILKFDFGRSEDIDNPFSISGKTNALKGLGTVNATPELGGFVEYSYEMINYSLEVRQGLFGHKGLIAETSLNLRGFLAPPGGKPSLFQLGPRLMFASADYNNAYFGIDQKQSLKSGLPRYKADSGLVSYGIGAFAIVPVSKSISLGAMGGYDRLTGEAAASPLIKLRGTKGQVTGSLRINYEF
jgi:outer membrane protein